jgi:hypothetical protein
MTMIHHITLSTGIELALTVLLAFTLFYCIVLERRLSALRKGQDGLKATIGELNTAITNAGASMRALKSSAAEAADQLDSRLSRSRGVIDELSLLNASGERIAQRIDRGSETRPSMPLPSGSVMNRLEGLRAVR